MPILHGRILPSASTLLLDRVFKRLGCRELAQMPPGLPRGGSRLRLDRGLK